MTITAEKVRRAVELLNERPVETVDRYVWIKVREHKKKRMRKKRNPHLVAFAGYGGEKFNCFRGGMR